MVVILAITTSGGLIYGRLTNRWGNTQVQIDAGARLAQIPLHIGAWKSDGSERLPDSARNELACTGDTSRQYVNTASGATIGVTLVVGPAGTIAVHKPEICFPSQNYRLLGNRKRVNITDARGLSHALWVVDFERQDLEGGMVRVYYAWTTNGVWQAPDEPRYKYLGSPYLYKLQVAAPVALSTPGATQDPIPAFLRDFLPEAGDELLSTAVSN